MPTSLRLFATPELALPYVFADAEDEALAAEVLAHLSSSCSDTPRPAQPTQADAPQMQSQPTTLPYAATQGEGLGQEEEVQPPAPGVAAALGAPPPLQWGPTQVLAQRTSALPPDLAQHLARMASSYASTRHAAEPTASALIVPSGPAKRRT